MYALDVDTTATTAHLTLAGELDMATTEQTRSAALAVLDADVSELCIHMSEVSFIDSSGLSVLVEIQIDAEHRGIDLELVDPSPRVLRLFEITGLVGVFKIS
jgi:anti-sigma B factor antagonist